MDKFRLQFHTGFPNLLIRDIKNSFPNAFVTLVLHEVFVEMLPVKSLPRCRSPRGEVHTVSYVTYMAFFREIAFPYISKHLLRHFSMEPTYAVHFLTSVACKSRHAETFRMVIGILASHSNQFIPRNAQNRCITAHVLAEQSLVEIVMTGRNRSVHRIKRRGPNQFQCLIERKSFLYIIQ